MSHNGRFGNLDSVCPAKDGSSIQPVAGGSASYAGNDHEVSPLHERRD